MDKQSRTYQAYVQILKEELIPAMGCTEPIAIAYAAAKARDVLGGMPDKVEIGVSSNIIKNVKSVIVPNTDGMKGIEAAAAAGGAAQMRRLRAFSSSKASRSCPAACRSRRVWVWGGSGGMVRVTTMLEVMTKTFTSSAP